MDCKNHILERFIPADPDGSILNSRLISNGYETSGWISHTGRWIAIPGCKETNLEEIFSVNEVINPPSWMPKTKNMTKKEYIKTLNTTGSTEADGYSLNE